MGMSQKDYRAIAQDIHRQVADCTNSEAIERIHTIVLDMAHYMAATNPRFDEVKFLQACGFRPVLRVRGKSNE